MTIGAFIARTTSRVLSEVIIFLASLQSPVRLAPQQIDALRKRVHQVLSESVGAVDGGATTQYEHEKVMAALKKLEDTIATGLNAVLADEACAALTAKERAKLQRTLVAVLRDAAHAGQRYQREVDLAAKRPAPPPLPKVIANQQGGGWDDDAPTEPQTPRAKR